MPNPAEAIHDVSLHHRMSLNRYSTATVRKVMAVLNRTEKAATDKLIDANITSFERVRVEQLLTEIRAIQAQGWVTIRARMTDAVAELTGNEIDFAERLATLAATASPAALGAAPASALTAGLQAAFTGAPALPQVIAAVNARPFQGRFLKDWLSEAEAGAAKRVRETIRQGFIEGKPTADIVRTLRGTAAAGYKDGVIEGTRRGVEAMVRTALTHTANVAQGEVFKAHADIILGVRWASVLDSRTTLLCASRDGNVYPLDSGPRPPAHINCRSICTPIVPQIPGVAPYTPPTYAEWLKKQSAAIQDDILGPVRGKLYRSGGVTVDRFVDRAGVTLTLDQLRARDAAAFLRAGL